MEFKLSPKYKDFLRYNRARVEILEGTTASGKTTTGMVKFILKVMQSDKNLHIISGQNLGVVEKNIITCELGIKDIFGDAVTYYPRGKGANGLPHLVITSGLQTKIVYVLGYDNSTRWKYALGGQYGCIYIDEINTAHMDYVRQAFMRCDYLMATLNPDDPDREIYKEFINRCRPIKKYRGTAPAEIEEMLNEPIMENWVWWYFSFNDNAGLTEEKKERIKGSHKPGSSDYRHYILGLRGKAEGIIFDNFETSKHVIKYSETLKYIKGSKENQNEYFVYFSSGLDTSYSKNSNDTISMSFIGITNKKRIFLLDEEVYNNKLEKTPFAPSDITEKYIKFLDRNRALYGFAKDVFIDSADQATIMELNKYKARNGCIYNFNPSYKAFKILDRITLQKGWLAKEQMLICDKCKVYINEMKIYSWSNKTGKIEPEDSNDHMINSVQYAWIPYKKLIG